jgi:hypothetical protein
MGGNVMPNCYGSAVFATGVHVASLAFCTCARNTDAAESRKYERVMRRIQKLEVEIEQLRGQLS